MVRVLKAIPWQEVGPLERDWVYNPLTHRIENLAFGVFYEIFNVVYEDTGELHHRGIGVCSRRIELHVPVRQSDGAIGFVWHHREKVIPPYVSEAEFAKDPSRPLAISEFARGVYEWELPHGLAVKALAEAEEETGYALVEACHIGFVKESPALGGVAHKLYASVLDDTRSSGKKPEEGEQIMGFHFFPPEEIRTIKTICALTQSALWRFRAWGLDHKDTFWQRIAARL